MLDEKTQDLLMEFFTRVLEFYRDFLALEKQKYSDVTEGRLDLLDGHIKNEQAYLLKARGLEQERMNLMADTQRPEAKFRELVLLFEEHRRPAVQKLFSELSSVIRLLQQTNTRCNRVTRLKLRQTSVILSKMENYPELKKVYGKNNSEDRTGQPAASRFSRKI